MKSSIKKMGLLGLVLLCGVGIISFVTKAVEIKTAPTNGVTQHTTVLHSLYLWDRGDGLTGAGLRVLSGRESLNVLNGFVAGTGSRLSQGKLVVVGGGIDNRVLGDGAGIGGGEENIAKSNSVVVGGEYNEAEDGSVVVGGGGGGINNRSKASNKGVILGGSLGKADGGVVLGGENNESQSGSIVLGKNSKGKAGSFAWNAQPNENSAQVNATNGLLVGTNTLLTDVKLVVTGAVKIGRSNGGNLGEIKLASNDECISAHDGTSYMALGGASANGECTNNGSCLYGGVYVQNGDTVVGYDVFYAIKPGDSCNAHKRTDIKCEGGVFTNMNDHKYLSCYDVDPRNPIYRPGN